MVDDLLLGGLHLKGRMHALHALVKYAGPRVDNELTALVLNRVEDACNERPGDQQMHQLLAVSLRQIISHRSQLIYSRSL